MKAKLSKILILTALLLSGLSHGQSSLREIKEPVLIQYEGLEGVFITIDFMDLNAEKLLDRKKLIKENKKIYFLLSGYEDKISILKSKEKITFQRLEKMTELRNKAEAQISLLNESLNNQVQITKNNKKRARRNGLLWFGGGVAVGITALALLIN